MNLLRLAAAALSGFASRRIPALYGAQSSLSEQIVAVTGSHIFARKKRSKYAPHQGKRERARRVAQMSTGMLRNASRGVW